MYSLCKKWQKPIYNANFFIFFYNIGPNLAQIFPKDHTHFNLFLFAGFQWNMLGDSININNFNCNPVILKIFC